MTSRVLVFDSQDRILLGLSAHSKEYSLPGGHANDGEHPVDTALRELKEECNVIPESFCHLGQFQGEEIFGAEVNQPISGQSSFDPDCEFVVCQWFSLDALPPNLSEKASDLIYHFLNERELVVAQHRQDLPPMPDGFDIRRVGSRWEVRTVNHPDLNFLGVINIPTQTAKILDFESKTAKAGEHLDWFEGLAREYGCLRVIGEFPEDEFWVNRKYRMTERGPGLDPSYKKVLTSEYIEVIINGKPEFELRDDTIWETLPGLAQRRTNGDKIEFRQVSDDGEVEDLI